MHHLELMLSGWTPTLGPLYDWKLRIKVSMPTSHHAVHVAGVSTVVCEPEHFVQRQAKTAQWRDLLQQ